MSSLSELVEMALEDTGKSLLDSGDFYGRHWERNRKLGRRFFLNQPRVTVRTFEDGDWEVVKNVVPVLASVLRVTGLSKKLSTEFRKFAERQDNLTWLDCMEKFAAAKHEPSHDLPKPITVNTANEELNLSQELQFTAFYYRNRAFVLLQLHNGCDVRGGYTVPRLFELNSDYWADLFAELEVWAQCECASGSDAELWDLKDQWVAQNGRVVCKKCGQPVEFW